MHISRLSRLNLSNKIRNEERTEKKYNQNERWRNAMRTRPIKIGEDNCIESIYLLVFCYALLLSLLLYCCCRCCCSTSSDDNVDDNAGGGHDNCRSHADCNCNLLPFNACARVNAENKWFLIYVIVSTINRFPDMLLFRLLPLLLLPIFAYDSNAQIEKRFETIKKNCAHDSWRLGVVYSLLVWISHCMRHGEHSGAGWVELDDKKQL